MQIVIVQQSPICNKREFLIELKIIERFKQESVATDLIKNIYFIFLVLNMKLTQVNRMLRRKIHGKVLVFFCCCVVTFATSSLFIRNISFFLSSAIQKLQVINISLVLFKCSSLLLFQIQQL